MEFPMPNTKLEGLTVVASVYTGDDDDYVLAITLDIKPPFYHVSEHNLKTGELVWFETHPNIVPAVESYEKNGGDY